MPALADAGDDDAARHRGQTIQRVREFLAQVGRKAGDPLALHLEHTARGGEVVRGASRLRPGFHQFL